MDSLVGELSAIDGIRAIVLGGSFARGYARGDSAGEEPGEYFDSSRLADYARRSPEDFLRASAHTE